MRRIWFVLAFLVSFLVVSSSQALLPVLVYSIARQAVIMTAETITIGVIAKGFAANDPYVRTTATMPRNKFSRGLSQLRGRWAGLGTLLAALAPLGWMYEDDIGFFVPKSNPHKGYCSLDPELSTYESCFARGFGDWPFFADNVSPVQQSSEGEFVYLCMRGLNSDGQTCINNAGAIFYVTQRGDTTKLPVTEAQINQQALPLIAASPNTLGDMLAGLSQSQLADLLDGATIPYNPTNPTPEMEQLKSDYRNGLLQTVDPNAPYYVTPDLLKRIQDLVAAEDAANSDDGTVDALNEKMKQPITQVQYEESNKKYADAVNAITDALPSNENNESDIDDSFTKLDEIITDIPNATLPSPANIQLPSYSECMTLSLTDGNGHNLVFPSGKQCEKINEMKRMFGYFLALAVAFALCWQLLNRPHG